MHLHIWINTVFARFSRNVVRNTLLYLLFVIMVAAAIYSLVEGKEINYIDGLWWALVTLTTVGYGDISPESVGMRIVAVWVMASGIVSVAVLTGWVAARMAVAAIEDASETQGIDDDFDSLANDLSDAVTRVQHIQERFRMDERGDDRVAAAAEEVCRKFGDGSLDARTIERLQEAIRLQEKTDA